MANLTYIDQYINDGQKETIKLPNLYDTILISNPDKTHIFRVPTSDFFIKHREELYDATIYITVPERAFYKPKVISLQYYGTTELWVSLLRVNGMKTVMDFHLPVIKIYEPNRLKDLIDIFFKREKKI